MNALILAVYNHKGGVGKTTTAASLGVAIHGLGHGPVLLVDCDPNASLSQTFGIRPRKGEPTVYEALLGEGVKLQDAIRPLREGLDLIPASEDFSAGEYLVAQQAGGEMILREALEEVRGRYRVIVIDSPPNYMKLNVMPLAAADGVVVPMSADFLSIRPTQESLKTIENVRRRLNPNLRIFGLLLTKYDQRTLHAREIGEQMRTAYPGVVFDDAVGFSVRFQEAPVGAETILDYAPTHPGAETYRAVARQLIARAYEGTTQVDQAAVS